MSIDRTVQIKRTLKTEVERELIQYHGYELCGIDKFNGMTSSRYVTAIIFADKQTAALFILEFHDMFEPRPAAKVFKPGFAFDF